MLFSPRSMTTVKKASLLQGTIFNPPDFLRQCKGDAAGTQLAWFLSLITRWPSLVVRGHRAAWSSSPAALHFLGAVSKPPVSGLPSCLLGHCRLIHLPSLWFTICSSWPLHSPLVLQPCFCNTNQPTASGSWSAASPVSSRPLSGILALSLSVPIQGPHDKMGSYPRYMGGQAGAWPMGIQFCAAKVLVSGLARKQEAPFAGSTRSEVLCLTCQCWAGSPASPAQVAMPGELGKLDDSGLLI